MTGSHLAGPGHGDTGCGTPRGRYTAAAELAREDIRAPLTEELLEHDVGGSW